MALGGNWLNIVCPARLVLQPALRDASVAILFLLHQSGILANGGNGSQYEGTACRLLVKQGVKDAPDVMANFQPLPLKTATT
jgi:hypothetical protein